MQPILLGLILVATIGGLYVRPFGARDWHVALAGGICAWVAGPLGFREGLSSIADSWSIEAFFLGLMLLAAGAEASGLYARLASGIQRLPGGRPRLGAVLVAGFVITTIFSNDATPLVLTPAVFAVAGRRGQLRTAALGVTFVADGASLVLPVSNPVNLLFYERFDLGFGGYSAHILPAAVAGVAVLAMVYLLSVRTADEARTGPEADPPDAAVVPHPVISLLAFGLVPVLGLAYVGGALAGIPLGLVTLGGGIALLAAEVGAGHFDYRHYRKHLSLGLLVFVASLLVLAKSVSEGGALDWLSSLLAHAADAPVLAAIVLAAVIAAVLSNLLNNWPAALLLAVAIESVAPASRGTLITGALIGCTIGANFTVVGSLSTVFWLSLTGPRGLHVSAGEYARAAFLPTAAGLAAACFVAALLA